MGCGNGGRGWGGRGGGGGCRALCYDRSETRRCSPWATGLKRRRVLSEAVLYNQTVLLNFELDVRGCSEGLSNSPSPLLVNSRVECEPASPRAERASTAKVMTTLSRQANASQFRVLGGGNNCRALSPGCALTPVLGPKEVRGMSNTREAPSSTVKRRLAKLNISRGFAEGKKHKRMACAS